MHDGSTYRRYRVRAPMEFACEHLRVAPSSALGYLVRVDTCGLCRSDLHFAESWSEDWDDLGHEFGGTVVAVRGEGRQFRVGDRVAVKNAAACGTCAACLTGRVRSCSKLVVNKQGFSEYAECDERSLVSARSLTDDLLALVEPTNVALDMVHSAALAPGERAAVLGGGTLGLITAFLLRRYVGLESVVSIGRREATDSFHAIGLDNWMTFDQARRPGSFDASIGGRPDCVLVTTPPSTLGDALDVCASGGRVLTVGLDRNGRLDAAVDVRTLIFKRARIEGVFAVPNLYFEESVDVLERIGAPLAALITRRIDFNDFPAEMSAWRSRGCFDGKARLRMTGGERSGRTAEAHLCSL